MFPIMYEAMIDLLVVLFGRVQKPEIVALFCAQPSATFADQVLNEDSQWNYDDIFLSFTVLVKVQELLHSEP